MPIELPIHIPLPPAVHLLRKLFSRHGHGLWLVGGKVRDALMGEPSSKDCDLATEAHPEQIQVLLNEANVRNFPKGESFGVWVAHMDGEDYEIATFREDGEYLDGRRPSTVFFSTAEADYKRRDLTINGLFYSVPVVDKAEGRVVDFGNGYGFADVMQRRIRMIGKPADRLNEDKLRVLRLVRFYCRFHDNDDFAGHVGEETMAAVQAFRDLRFWGISSERIREEFLASVRQAKSMRCLLNVYQALDLLPVLFPSMPLSPNGMRFVQDTDVRDPAVILACLFGDCVTFRKDLRKRLNSLTWPNGITDDVDFLSQMLGVTQRKEMVRLCPGRTPERQKQMGVMNGFRPERHLWQFLTDYEPPRYDGNVLVAQGLTGPEVGARIMALQLEDMERAYAVAGGSFPAERLESAVCG